ncbi:GNAT family N-acetyltransferase [Rhizorhabdus wittichii]
MDYWYRIFNRDAIVVDNGSLSVAVNPALSEPYRAMLLQRDEGPVLVALSPALAERSGIDRNRDISLAALRGRLTDGGVTLHDPDFLFYFPDVPVPTPVARLRRLTEADREAFGVFRAEASEQDLDDAYVELDHWAAFGCFEGDRLVSAASVYPWGNALIADIGVLTLPDARGKGYARAVVHAIGRYAREQGHEPQYRCQIDNAASVALAKASGLMPFGTWEVGLDRDPAA